MPKTYRTAYLSAETTPSNTPSDMLTSDSTARKVIVPIKNRAFQLVFNRKEVTEFLDNYNRITDNASLTNNLKIKVLPNFCKEHCRRFVKQLKPYAIGN
jgi:hypothetical protein